MAVATQDVPVRSGCAGARPRRVPMRAGGGAPPGGFVLVDQLANVSHTYESPIRAPHGPFHRGGRGLSIVTLSPYAGPAAHTWPGRSLPGLSATAPGRTGTWCDPGRRAQRIDGCADRLSVVLAERLLCTRPRPRPRHW